MNSAILELLALVPEGFKLRLIGPVVLEVLGSPFRGDAVHLLASGLKIREANLVRPAFPFGRSRAPLSRRRKRAV
jgi:hypothetical protein